MVRLLVVVCVALALAGLLLGVLWLYERRSHRDTVVRLENERAAQATTHREILAVKDSEVAVATRLAFQRAVQVEEALRRASHAEGLVAHARAEVRLLADSLQAVTLGSAVTDTSRDVVVATGRLDATDTLGLVIDAQVEITPPVSTWTWGVVRRPLDFSLTLGCQGTAAVAHLVGPPWASFDLFHVEQDPGLCNPIPRARWQPFKLRVPSLLEVVLLVGAGVVLGGQLDMPP